MLKFLISWTLQAYFYFWYLYLHLVFFWSLHFLLLFIIHISTQISFLRKFSQTTFNKGCHFQYSIPHYTVLSSRYLLPLSDITPFLVYPLAFLSCTVEHKFLENKGLALFIATFQCLGQCLSHNRFSINICWWIYSRKNLLCFKVWS